MKLSDAQLTVLEALGKKELGEDGYVRLFGPGPIASANALWRRGLTRCAPWSPSRWWSLTDAGRQEFERQFGAGGAS